ncbi:MAG TPA: hypothetical protein EYN38_09785 [Flavobacteriales bacterium]|jgi:hypothetical protein|nr:hypothetical protein [Flavobacteriales bacterium]HIA12556.1 hypothetical protein [Flavobacteriales bacterium]HIO73379.1 hypothetical protein [Flavobacteriales bacterium]
MSLKDKIYEDFLVAFKARETDKKNFLGVIKGEIMNDIGRGTDPNDENVLKILKSIEKGLKETGTDEAMKELEYLAPYMPALMSEDEVTKIIEGLIADGKSDIGSIMKEFNTTYRGKADNGMVSNVVRTKLG